MHYLLVLHYYPLSVISLQSRRAQELPYFSLKGDAAMVLYLSSIEQKKESKKFETVCSVQIIENVFIGKCLTYHQSSDLLLSKYIFITNFGNW